MKINLTTTPQEVDVCDFLNNNPCLKEVVGQVLEEYVDYTNSCVPLENVSDAARHIADQSDWLFEIAVRVDERDTVQGRESLLEAAAKLGAMVVSFLERIGDVKSKENDDE